MHGAMSYNVESQPGAHPLLPILLSRWAGSLPLTTRFAFFLYEKIIKARMWLAELLKVNIKEAKERSQLRWR